MDTTPEVISKDTHRHTQSRTPRRLRSLAEKRRIVEETLVPGASVSIVARRHDVNANLVFGWRKLYHAGLLTTPAPTAAVLVPVRVKRAVRQSARAPRAAMTPIGVIEIELRAARLRLHGPVDPHTLRAVIGALT